ncbi:hypothetical protein [Bacillus sp. M6-12]|uniref:hypothetical protein n=1 Tax=Bacillus sp. M6-12 TaxID=2054166 RepID=UPI0015E0891F|nr:hypothetical protein [Bacillus sp. M6-12]
MAVDFRSSGGSGASSALCACGVSLDPLFPQDIELASLKKHRTKEMRSIFEESHAFRSNDIVAKSTISFNIAYF